MVLEDHPQRAGHQTVGVHNVEAALNVLARSGIDLVISDLLQGESCFAP